MSDKAKLYLAIDERGRLQPVLEDGRPIANATSCTTKTLGTGPTLVTVELLPEWLPEQSKPTEAAAASLTKGAMKLYQPIIDYPLHPNEALRALEAIGLAAATGANVTALVAEIKRLCGEFCCGGQQE